MTVTAIEFNSHRQYESHLAAHKKRKKQTKEKKIISAIQRQAFTKKKLYAFSFLLVSIHFFRNNYVLKRMVWLSSTVWLYKHNMCAWSDRKMMMNNNNNNKKGSENKNNGIWKIETNIKRAIDITMQKK